MTGATKAVALIALAVIVVACLNVAMYRRMKATLRAGREREAAEAGSPAEAEAQVGKPL